MIALERVPIYDEESRADIAVERIFVGHKTRNEVLAELLRERADRNSDTGESPCAPRG